MTGAARRFLAQVFGRPGLVLHGGTPVAQRAGARASASRRTTRRRSSSSRSRPAAPASTSPRRRTSSTSTAGGTRRSRTRRPTARSASARSGTCWCTSSSAAARVEERIDALIEAKQALVRGVLQGGGEAAHRDERRGAAATVALDLRRPPLSPDVRTGHGVVSRYWDSCRPYVPVAERRARGDGPASCSRRASGAPAGHRAPNAAVANTFWGKAWCDNLESYSDFANRLPRGRTTCVTARCST